MSTSSDIISLRNFVVDEDRANLGADLYKSLDKNAYILAQRDAIEAYNLARAIRLSEQSAAIEERRRLSQAEQAARSLARSWNVDGLQSTLIKNSSSSSSPKVSSSPSSVAAAVAATTNTTTTTTQKRRKASISQYSYSSYQHNQSNIHTGTSQASVQAHHQQQLEARKHSSASSRDIQAGHILNPTKEASASSSSSSSSRQSVPSSSASAQAAAAEREKEKGKERSRSNSSSSMNARRRSSSVSAAPAVVQSPLPLPPPPPPPPPQVQPQPQPQPQVPRDIFGPTRFACSKCASPLSSLVLSQVSSFFYFIFSQVRRFD